MKCQIVNRQRCRIPEYQRRDMCFWYVGAIIWIWLRLNQMSKLPKLQNYSLGRDTILSEFSLISLLPEDISGFSVGCFMSLCLLFLSSGKNPCFNSISSAAEHPENYLFLLGEWSSNVLLMERKSTAIHYGFVMRLKSRLGFMLLRRCQQKGTSARLKSPCPGIWIQD